MIFNIQNLIHIYDSLNEFSELKTPDVLGIEVLVRKTKELKPSKFFENFGVKETADVILNDVIIEFIKEHQSQIIDLFKNKVCDEINEIGFNLKQELKSINDFCKNKQS